MKGNADASSLKDFGFILDTPGSLILPNIVSNFEGMYTCIARTILNGINIGEDNSSAEIVVTGMFVDTCIHVHVHVHCVHVHLHIYIYYCIEITCLSYMYM